MVPPCGAWYFKALDDAVPGREVRAEGRVLHRTGRVLLAEADLFDAAGELVARGTGEFLVSRIDLRSLPGYVP